MKVIKSGRAAPNRFRVTCQGCDAILEYVDDDTQLSGELRDGKWVEFRMIYCPECLATIQLFDEVPLAPD